MSTIAPTRSTTTSDVHVLGVRHHGPGSARSVKNALEAIAPSIVLVEGPPDADALIPLLIHAEMVPPVALLVYRPEKPKDSVYYPFAEFSPEWQALKYALDRGIPARFMDLPIAHQIGDVETVDQDAGVPTPEGEPLPRRPVDPLGMLAKAAGFDDGERWWEFVVEGRRDGADLFASILDAMAEVRSSVPEEGDPRELRREAYMRQTIREAQREGHGPIAVICGAWHAPALKVANWPAAKHDAALLKGLPKTKVAATWAPWTYGRLSRESGYGAGIASPGWYDHLWSAPDQVVERWLTRVARLLREERLDASSASVIEAVRLADALATLRGRPLADLSDLEEATRTVLCFGEETPMRLIRRKLIVGERLGAVPEETPSVPLQQDLNRLQKRLRLPPDPAQTTKTLDLREPTDLERSRLLHRLSLLSIDWGKVTYASGKGTFKESWQLQWKPELAVSLIEAGLWGATVEDAATAFAADRADHEDDLPAMTALLGRAMLADLPDAIRKIMEKVEAQAAVAADVTQLMDALPPLANLMRYGDVRKTDAAMVGHAASRMVIRICVGLPLACSSLDDSAASSMFEAILRADAAIGLMDDDEARAAWHAVLARLSDSESIHGLVTGRCVRILLDAHEMETAEVARLMNLAVSPASDPSRAAAWVAGFLRQSGEVLYHDDALFGIFDGWLAQLSSEAFPALLPMLRRTFGTFEPPLRRSLGERAARSGGASTVTSRGAASEVDLDVERAETVLPLISKLLGLGGGGTQP
ncbi:MAG: DUF5682 family protein [Paludisphaera borealis]|uniref:DUF5682 family protein n=1 Tax=Paludisphaera borealis TaxID=1387353 RepID=UPI002845A0AD|nr:DUF5682 family protein [Paludisphaera borealis]MDR3621682.1 DUF5682 family protein [Paludisphaera borealis]